MNVTVIWALRWELNLVILAQDFAGVMPFWFSWDRNLIKLYEIIRKPLKAILLFLLMLPISKHRHLFCLFSSLVYLLSFPQPLTGISSFSSEDSFRASVNLDLQSFSLNLHLWHSNIKYLYWFTLEEKKHVHPLSSFLPHIPVFQVLFYELTNCPMSDTHLLLYHNDILLTKS